MGTAAQRRRGNTSRNKQYGKARRTKNSAPTRDIDQIVFVDMQPEATAKLLNQEIDENKPGLGQHYCIGCARYLVNEHAMQCHLRTKEHKKRAKVIKNDVPYTHEESLRAAGVKPALKTTAQAAAQI